MLSKVNQAIASAAMGGAVFMSECGMHCKCSTKGAGKVAKRKIEWKTLSWLKPHEDNPRVNGKIKEGCGASLGVISERARDCGKAEQKRWLIT